MTDARLDAMARHMWDARRAGAKFANLAADLKPGSIAEAYAAQEAYHRLAEPVYGPVGGVKVATTTKVMQQLMGITHPCGGAIFAKHDPRFAGAHRQGRFHQPAGRERDRARARRTTCRPRARPGARRASCRSSPARWRPMS